MRLHALRMTAFGPFAATEQVDFDALGDAGLFLLHGPTGAGKTTVLDAVCFALYGTVPGARQQGGRLRSDHADPAVAPRVELEVTLRGRRFLLARSPAWDRPKRRGAGTTKAPAQVVLTERLVGGDLVLSTRLDEVGHQLQGLIGMSGEQFCQVVLLPQGLFAEFLRAGAEDRRPLLEQLFGTARFSRVEHILAEQRREGSRAVEEAEFATDALLARVAQEAGVATVPESARGGGAAEWAGDLLTEARAAADQAEADCVLTRALLDTARAADVAAAATAERQARATRLQARATALQCGAAQRAETVGRTAAARRAAPVIPLIDLVVTERARAAGAAAAAEGLRAAATLRAAGLGDADETALRAAAAAARDELVRLRALDPLAAELPALAERSDRLSGALVVYDEERAAHERWVADAAALREELRRSLEQETHATAALAGATQAAADAVARRAAAARRDELRLRHEQAIDEERRLHAWSLDARERCLDLRRRRLDGMAAELAAGLSEGTPCPVCGSDTHPTLAAAAPDVVAGSDEENAEQAAAAARTEHEAATRRSRDLGAELADARARAGGDGSLDDLDDLARAASAQASGLTRLATRLDGTRAALAGHDDELLRRHDAISRAAVARATTAAELATTTARHAEASEQLALALRGAASLTARLGDVRRLAEGCARAADALADAQRAVVASTSSEGAAAEAVRAAGFADPAAALAAVLPAVEVERLAAKTAGEIAEQAQVRSELADPSLVAALGNPPPDLATLGATLRRAEDAHEAASARRPESRRRHVALEQLVVRLAGHLDALRPLHERHQTVAALSFLLEGTGTDNALRMRLSAYVLAARLEQVAAAATERLLRMSAGRYTLVHTDDAGAGRARSGLGLRVCDGWTGSVRETSTLSGGESFIASLALALGLADVVTAEAGGATLDTLFIDEGFGSLDEETLDEVVDVLDGLREAGRVVGVVSHVAELRTRIPARLFVAKGPTGSSLRHEGVAISTARVMTGDASTGRGAA